MNRTDANVYIIPAKTLILSAKRFEFSPIGATLIKSEVESLKTFFVLDQLITYWFMSPAIMLCVHIYTRVLS